MNFLEIKTIVLFHVSDVLLPIKVLLDLYYHDTLLRSGQMLQGRIQDLIRGGPPDRDRPKTAILGPQFCRILVLGPHFWWSGGARAPGPPPWIRPCVIHEYLNLYF